MFKFYRWPVTRLWKYRGKLTKLFYQTSQSNLKTKGLKSLFYIVMYWCHFLSRMYQLFVDQSATYAQLFGWFFGMLYLISFYKSITVITELDYSLIILYIPKQQQHIWLYVRYFNAILDYWMLILVQRLISKPNIYWN